MGTPEVYLTAKQARERFRMSEGGQRAAVSRGDFPAPIVIGGKRLWAQSRLDAFERDLHADAAKREAAARVAAGAKPPEPDDEDPFGPADDLSAEGKPAPPAPPAPSLKAKMGRPLGSKNRPKAAPASVLARGPANALPAHLGGPSLLDQLRGAR